jgi:predicted CoA-binding protein
VPLTSDHDIARVLAGSRSIAVLGASDDPARPSHQVMRFLIEEGYEVHPVNPGLAGTQVLGCTVCADLSEITASVDMVDVFRQAQHLPAIVQQVLELGIGTLWTQLGVVHAAALEEAESHGLDVVEDRCPAIELPRLRAMGIL